MKRIIPFLLFLPLFSIAQKIKLNEYDKFIQQRRIESFPLTLKDASDVKMDITLIAIGTTYYVQLSGSGVGTNVISESDKVIFLLENDDTITVRSKGYQNYDITATGNSYKHDYLLSLYDLERLSTHNLEALRKYHAKKYDDVYIPKENRDKVKKLSSLFMDELKKGGLLQPQLIARAPGFPGGQDVWMNFLRRNLKPPADLEKGEEKTVVVQFKVAVDGSVSDIKIVQSPGPYFDTEVLRVLARMPKWKSAIEHGRQVDAIVTQSITFYRTDTVQAQGL